MLFLVAAGLVVASPGSEPATEPVSAVDPSGIVSVTVVVPQSEADVRAALSDPERAAALPPEVISVTTLARGNCITLGVTVKGAWDPLHYTTLRCPTPGGFKYRLLQSDSITAYEAEWSLVPHAGGGTEVTYRVHTEIDLPIPRALIRKGVLQSAKDTVMALIRRVSAGRTR